MNLQKNSYFYSSSILFTFIISQFVIVNGLTEFSSFLFNLDYTTESLSDLQHSSLNHDSLNSNSERTCEEIQSCNDQAGFEAIKWLHRQLDDDQNGNVDMSESEDFFKTDLNHSDANEKQLQFHGNDKHISVEDLWLYWIRSEVHNWTVDQAVDWLKTSVELGQYEDTFRNNKINGTSFPKLASSQTFLPATLGVKDPIHKQKISLKAMDLVLFGMPKTHNYSKDLLLVFSFLVAMLGCFYAALQRKNSQNHLKKMLRDMEALQKAEQQLGNLQVELHQAKREQEEAKSEKERLEENLLKEGSYPHFYLRDSSLPNVGNLNKICELEEELRLTKEHLTRLEDAMEKKQWSPPQKLQYWLQLTHELELKNHNIKRQAAEMQLLAAKEGCEKLKKKRSSFLGSFRVAHGSSIDDVDNRILQAKESLSEVTKDLQERLYRWKQIERLCNFTIQQNRGEIFLQSELYKQLISNGKKNNVMTNSMQRTGSEGTLIESEDSYSLNANQIGFSTGSNVNIHNMNYRVNPSLNNEKFNKQMNQPKNLNVHEKKINSLNDENLSEETTDQKNNFVTGEGAKENSISNKKNLLNGKSLNTENSFEKDENDFDLQSNINSSLTCESDFFNSSMDNSKLSTTDLTDSSKSIKKRKSYKKFFNLKKISSKYSSQDSH